VQYATGGVPEVWIIDLGGDVVETHRMPSAGRYQVVQRVGRGQQMSPGAYPEVVLTVDELLG
jgi:Uma2 family endonuclease